MVDLCDDRSLISANRRPDHGDGKDKAPDDQFRPWESDEGSVNHHRESTLRCTVSAARTHLAGANFPPAGDPTEAFFDLKHAVGFIDSNNLAVILAHI